MKKSAANPALHSLLGALGEPVRLRILRILDREELSVGEVARIVQLPQSTVSRHLKVLAEGAAGGWLTRRAEGTATLYRLILDDLPEPTRTIWVAIRDQLGHPDSAGRAELEEDLRRLAATLAERREDAHAFFGRVAGQWDDIRNELFGDRFTPLALLGLLNPEWTVADLGCGTGNAAEMLAPFVRRVIAVDQSAPMLKAARQRLSTSAADRARNIDFVRADLAGIPLEDRSVHAAVCVLVLHHIDKPAAILSEMRRILRPDAGGGVALVVDMLEHNRESLRRSLGHRWAGFSESTMRSWLNDAGFADVRFHILPARSDAAGPGLFACAARILAPSRDAR